MFKKLLCVVLCSVLLSSCSSSTDNNTSPQRADNVSAQVAAADLNVQLGMGYLRQGDMQRAKRKLLAAVAQAPDWAPAQEAMGYFLLSTGDSKRAEQYYLRAVNINPNAGAAQNNYGVYLCRVGRYGEADKHYMLAVQDPNYINTAEAYENAGLCALQARNAEKALPYFQRAIAQDPKRATSYLELAQINYQLNKIPLAQQYFNNYLILAANNLGADGLWLGVRLARVAHDTALARQYTLQLQNNYPSSNEYRQLLKTTSRAAPMV